MSNHVYQISELTGSSTSSSDDAIRTALARAAQEGPEIKWFEVTGSRGQVVNGQVAHWQVTIKIGRSLN